MTLQEIIAIFDAKPAGKDYAANCPAHNDSTPSLSIASGNNGGIVMKCHAGCPTEKVLAAKGLKLADLMPDKPITITPIIPKISEVYDYTDADGKLIFQVVRYAPKTFKQRRPNPKNPAEWLWNLSDVIRPLYRLPDILKAKAEDKIIFLAEGEKDANALIKLGVHATCNSGGACKWTSQYTKILTNAHVVNISHKDDAGRKHSLLVANALFGKAADITIVELPDRNDCSVNDAYDWIQAGGTLEEFQKIINDAKEWTPLVNFEGTQSTLNTANTIDLQARFFQIQMAKGLTPGERYGLMAKVVMEKLHACGRFFFHAEHRDFATAMFFDGHRKLLLPIANDQFLAWLSALIGINRTEKAFQFILAAVQDEALTGKTTGLLPESFWASRPGSVYISNGDGHLVKITSEGSTLVDNGTDEVLFPSGDTLKPWKLIEPKNPFEYCTLFKSMSTTAPHGKLLFELWVCAMASNQRTKPPLVLSGPVGSGKTRVASGVAELFGLPPRITAITKNGEEDFWTQQHAGGMVCYDNADTRTDWLADALAAASTDGTREKRRLYTDTARIIQRARSWAIITSANPTFAADAGLADRLLVVRLERRTDETAESALSDEIAANRDAGMSYIADVISVALSDNVAVPGGINKRHPDFASLAVRMGRAIGREQDAIDALKNAEADKSMFNLENDEVGNAMIELMNTQNTFEGTAAELLEQLKTIDSSFEGRMSVKRLAKRLVRLWPHLVSMFDAKQEPGHGGKKTLWFKNKNEISTQNELELDINQEVATTELL
jgi:hypothetical protein